MGNSNRIMVDFQKGITKEIARATEESQDMIKFTRLGRLISDYFFLFVFLLFFASAFIADWTLNPIHNLFFARLTGFLFYNLHASSLMAVSLVGVYFLVKTRLRDISRTVLGIAGLGAIHEFVWGSFYGSLFLSSNIRYYSAFGIFLILAYIFCRAKQRRALSISFIFITPYELFGIVAGVPLTQTDLFTPTEYFNALIPNAFEVLSWILISLVYLLVCLYYSPNHKKVESVPKEIPNYSIGKRITDCISNQLLKKKDSNNNPFDSSDNFVCSRMPMLNPKR